MGHRHRLHYIYDVNYHRGKAAAYTSAVCGVYCLGKVSMTVVTLACLTNGVNVRLYLYLIRSLSGTFIVGVHSHGCTTSC